MKKIETSNAPTSAGHYSQAVVHNGIVYVSGQLSIDPITGEKRTGTIEEQTRQVIENLRGILIAAGSGLDRVLKTTVYIADIKLWDRVDKVYGEAFGEHKPARALVPTRELHYGFLIEIEAVATCDP